MEQFIESPKSVMMKLKFITKSDLLGLYHNLVALCIFNMNFVIYSRFYEDVTMKFVVPSNEERSVCKT